MKKKNATKSILNRLFSIADPVISRFPGRDVEEKRLVFNTILVMIIIIVYLSPLMLPKITSAPSISGLVVVFLLLITSYFVLKYLYEVREYYIERLRKTRKQT